MVEDRLEGEEAQLAGYCRMCSFILTAEPMMSGLLRSSSSQRAARGESPATAR